MTTLNDLTTKELEIIMEGLDLYVEEHNINVDENEAVLNIVRMLVGEDLRRYLANLTPPPKHT